MIFPSFLHYIVDNQWSFRHFQVDEKILILCLKNENTIDGKSKKLWASFIVDVREEILLQLLMMEIFFNSRLGKFSIQVDGKYLNRRLWKLNCGIVRSKVRKEIFDKKKSKATIFGLKIFKIPDFKSCRTSFSLKYETFEKITVDKRLQSVFKKLK